ncbi:MAG: hypothetical protein JXQ73_14995 [Phycisphaerae bacterium]|nr:hypothetical protein [Phycisphaerae bacterium]
MSDGSCDNVTDLLLGRQMDLLEPDERERLEEAIAADPSLKTQQERLARLLGPLDAWQPAPSPKHFVQSIMARVEGADVPQQDEPVETIKFDRSLVTSPSESDGSMMPSLMSFRDVLAVAASILIIVGVFVPSYYGVQRRAQQAQNTAGVSGLGEAIGSYARDHSAYSPTPGWRGTVSYIPQGVLEDEHASNTGHPFLLVQPRPRKYVNPKLQVVPGHGEDAVLPTEGEGQQDLDLSGDSWQNLPRPVLHLRLHPNVVIPGDLLQGVKKGRLRLQLTPLDGALSREPEGNATVTGDGQGDEPATYLGVKIPKDANDSLLVQPK